MHGTIRNRLLAYLSFDGINISADTWSAYGRKIVKIPVRRRKDRHGTI